MESESPPARSTILSTFLRGRPRNSSQSFAAVEQQQARELSPPPAHPPSPAPPRTRRNNGANGGTTPAQLQPSTSQPQPSAGLALSQMLRRRRSAGNVHNNNNSNNNPNNNPAQAQTQQPPTANPTTQAALALAGYTPAMNPAATTASPQPAQTTPPAPATTNTNGPSHRIRLVPHLDSRRSLRFDPIGRDLREGDPALRIGRFTDRNGLGLAAINSLNSNKLAFRSKVVSRAHAEIWVEAGAKFFIRDTKSSSGTFLNHVRLSPANAESRPFQIKDGDILQLGVDYQGGAEDIYKSVKIRVEIGREWQAGVNAFNTTAFKNLKALALPAQNGSSNAATTSAPPAHSGKIKALGIPDCCICLFSVTIRQALFIAPCSHTFHYKCIRPILEAHHPSFTCPLCRTYADLDEDVEVDEGSWEVDVSGNENDLIDGTNDDEEGKNNKKKSANDEAVESVLSAVGAVSGATGSVGRRGLGLPGGSGGPIVSDVGEEDEEGDDRMDVDQDGRDGGALTPNDQIPVSGEEEDIDSDNAHQNGQVINASGSHTNVNNTINPNHPNNNNNSGGNNPFASSASLGVTAGATWGSPGAGSSTSARGDSPIPGLNIGAGQVTVGAGNGEEDVGGVVIGPEGIEGDTVSGKRKR